MVEIEGLAVKDGIGLKVWMLIGMLTKSKIEILLKNGVTLDRVHTGVSTIDDIADVAVDTDKTNNIGVLTEVVTDASYLELKNLLN